MRKTSKITSQQFLNGEVHNWYRIVLGFSDHLVSYLLDSFQIRNDEKVIDPFCGTGTTLIECMKRGIECTGIEANPSSFFAAKVKTNWRLEGERLLELLEDINERQFIFLESKDYIKDPTYIYLEKTGMIERGWISPKPLQKAIALKNCILSLNVEGNYKNALMLALIAEVVYGGSNIKFGPELYCGTAKTDANVFEGFANRVQTMANDLGFVSSMSDRKAKLILGDSRYCSELLRNFEIDKYSAIICSPPYPAEHDYTRNSRLELAFLEEVSDRKTLQIIKRRMVRSNTKGIYKEDSDAQYVKGHPQILGLVRKLEKKVKYKTYGFAKLYPVVVQEYFGGMKRHLLSIKNNLRHGAMCGYVVGDQSSYFQVHIPTAEILSSMAEEIGFETVEIKHWRSRWSTTTSKEVKENILVLRNQA